MENTLHPFEEIIKKRTGAELLLALLDFQKMEETGILETPSFGREIHNEYRKIAKDIGFTEVHKRIAAECVRRLLKFIDLHDLKLFDADNLDLKGFIKAFENTGRDKTI